MVNFINRLVGATLVVALIESGRPQGSPLRKKQYNYNLKVRTEGALIYCYFFKYSLFDRKLDSLHIDIRSK